MHALAARLLGMSLVRLRILPGALRAALRGRHESPQKLVWVYLSGPAGNLLAAAIFACSQGFGRFLFEANLAIGLLNLIPIHPLDGGQILLLVLYGSVGSSKTLRLLGVLSAAFRSMFFILGILQLVWFGNPSLLIIALAVLPGRKPLEETMSMIRLHSLFNRRQRILKKKIYPARHLVAMEDCSLGEIVQKLDYDRFHIIYVLNSAMEITGRVTEQQILRALQHHGARESVRNILT
ncbi:MAG TPA: hypothetical protein PLD49_05965 [Thermoclostridium caenicola]|uniref:site-2 protease family protein n=1 Tax=Thermoclostridium caenicola TaxID=659425 RepID=UPI002CFE8181|nr:site-2 protease family protein [Thermoclostridium caenicola]HOK43192.1 hypothetical protein [Thermoclostridium caenicola]HOL84454.1 hypothetical protein [Thermoclostridium caenicola]HPO75890.1 hypothetical protein [Thermoclostridium caenicola]